MTRFLYTTFHSPIVLTVSPIPLQNATTTLLSPHKPRSHFLPLHDANYTLATIQSQDLSQPHFTLLTLKLLHYHISQHVSRFPPTWHIPLHGKNLPRHLNRSPLDTNASYDGGYMGSYPHNNDYSAMAPATLNSVQSAAR